MIAITTRSGAAAAATAAVHSPIASRPPTRAKRLRIGRRIDRGRIVIGRLRSPRSGVRFFVARRVIVLTSELGRGPATPRELPENGEELHRQDAGRDLGSAGPRARP